MVINLPTGKELEAISIDINISTWALAFIFRITLSISPNRLTSILYDPTSCGWNIHTKLKISLISLQTGDTNIWRSSYILEL